MPARRKEKEAPNQRKHEQGTEASIRFSIKGLIQVREMSFLGPILDGISP